MAEYTFDVQKLSIYLRNDLNDLEEYRSSVSTWTYKKALEFYENHNKIEKIGIDLRDQALSSPLLDAKNFSKNFYNKLHEIYTSH